MRPKEIKPRAIRSRNQFKSTLFGYWRKKFGPLGRVGKEERPFNTIDFTPGLHQLPDSVQYNTSKLIKESILNRLRKHASREVSTYMKTPDGQTLKSKVSELIRGKMRGPKKV